MSQKSEIMNTKSRNFNCLFIPSKDTGVSVRKRVIKILRDICIEYPEQEKIPDICVKMIRRVNDEEGIQKLVMDVFMTMWFTPSNPSDKVRSLT